MLRRLMYAAVRSGDSSRKVSSFAVNGASGGAQRRQLASAETGLKGRAQVRSLIAGARSTNVLSALERTAVRGNALARNSLTA
jgi:hypothetical protein